MQRRLVLCALLILAAAPFVRGQATGAVYVATYVEVRPGNAMEGRTLAAQYAAAAGAAPGNLRVDALQEVGRPNRLVIIEAWRDQAALADHAAAAQTADFVRRLESIQRAPYDRRIHGGFSVDPAPVSAAAAGGSDAVFVVTHVDVPGPSREQTEVLLKQLAESSRRDAGHIKYDVYQQRDRTNHFTVYAAWNATAAFDASGDTEHGRGFRTALAPMLGALYDERVYRRIAQ